MVSFHKPTTTQRTKTSGQNISLKGDHWKMISLQEIHTFDSKIKVVTTLQPHHTLNGVPLYFFSSSRTTEADPYFRHCSLYYSLDMGMD